MNKYKTILAIAAVLILVIAALPILFSFYQEYTSRQSIQNDLNSTNNGPAPTQTSLPSVVSTGITWGYDGTKWSNSGKQLQCPSPFFSLLPVDINKVSGILYPGQVRGNDFKAHGGFRFDKNPDNAIRVQLPIDAHLWRGSRYIESGEVQYILDFIAPCGILIRFDHLLTLSPEFMSIVEADLPVAKENESRTYFFKTQRFYNSGTVIASEVGFKKTKNVSLDFGVYDLRQQNEASQNSTWASKYSSKKETAYYGICWLNEIAQNDKRILLSLDGFGVEGITSDYCKDNN